MLVRFCPSCLQFEQSFDDGTPIAFITFSCVRCARQGKLPEPETLESFFQSPDITHEQLLAKYEQSKEDVNGLRD